MGRQKACLHTWQEVPILLAQGEQGLRLLCCNWFLRASHQASGKVHVTPCVLDAPSQLANALLMHAGLARPSMRHETTHASALLSWASAKRGRSQCTPLERSAQRAGPRRTRHACASLHLASA